MLTYYCNNKDWLKFKNTLYVWNEYIFKFRKYEEDYYYFSVGVFLDEKRIIFNNEICLKLGKKGIIIRKIN